ncbi:hypothetical protein SDRG_17315 [Saprolegnia diclina VS20]|uniref:F-box domain-containing protein n=1 Tax=Saprolegnia diclina (strain VS20) TaxID=1156394 RepID=T0R5L1_SAPDV|nr:hypothetical protein SDRG_17315 [Saprolegnia diclina VS20]EQC24792.1 hypothetical protein SDRG_17315 [Saprolegnia diclina VS20]|eukprot:XP_008621778.1 hypothetical protein SDRG_17315 [Saprolegnia diclina VS20]
MPSSVRAYWPSIALHDMDLSPDVLARLAATLPLHPRISLGCHVRDAAPLASLVAVVGSALSCVTLELSSKGVAHGRGKAMSDLLLQRCPRLRDVTIKVEPRRRANDLVELNDALGIVAHPHVEVFKINLLHAAATPRLGHLLAAWLSTAPSRFLQVANVADMDHDGLVVFNVPSLGGFHGRTLPVSLITLEWKSHVNDDQALTDLATAVGRTELKHLACNVFGQLATHPAAAPMLSQLQRLIVSGLNAYHTKVLVVGLSAVPALKSLTLCNCNLASSMELLMETLATTCVHLVKLQVRDPRPTRDGATAVFTGVLRSPHLTSLSMSMRLSDPPAANSTFLTWE